MAEKAQQRVDLWLGESDGYQQRVKTLVKKNKLKPSIVGQNRIKTNPNTVVCCIDFFYEWCRLDFPTQQHQDLPEEKK